MPASSSPTASSPTPNSPASSSPTPSSPASGSLLARRQLGRRLRALRKRAGKTLADVAVTGIGSETKLYRMETGQVAVRTGDVRDLCVLYGAADGLLDGLLALARASKQGSWQEDYEDVLIPGFGLFIDLEAAATTLQAYDPELVHGLLQTPDYSRAVIETGPINVGESQVRRELEVRAARQRATRERQPPLRITQILGEAALSRVIGSPEVMAAQVEQLRALNRLEQVEIRVLPWRVGSHPAIASGPFTIMDFADPADPDVVYLESITGARYLEQANHLRTYRRVWDILARQSIPLEEHLA
jgi:transcriptional regulator with XRE-family HTH domain